jgi:hypothetical protein
MKEGERDTRGSAHRELGASMCSEEVHPRKRDRHGTDPFVHAVIRAPALPSVLEFAACDRGTHRPILHLGRHQTGPRKMPVIQEHFGRKTDGRRMNFGNAEQFACCANSWSNGTMHYWLRTKRVETQ